MVLSNSLLISDIDLAASMAGNDALGSKEAEVVFFLIWVPFIRCYLIEPKGRQETTQSSSALSQIHHST